MVGACLCATAACADDAATAPDLHNVDRERLAQLVAQTGAGDFGNIRSLVLSAGGSAPVEHYFRGTTRNDLEPLYSITKSVTSLVTGLAIAGGALDSVRMPLVHALPERATLIRADAQRAQLTVQDLLTMRAGIQWNELREPYGAPGNPLTQLLSSTDWVAYALGQPMASAPGTSYTYNSGASILLGEAVGRASGRSVEVLARQGLLEPLGISHVTWHVGPLGVVNTGGGLSMRPIDLHLIGRMVAQQGMFGSRRVVPAAWLSESFTPRSVAPASTRYGYQWWLLGPDGRYDAARPVFAGIGWGGQLLLIFPHHDLVAAITARNFDLDALVAAQRWVVRLEALLLAPGE